MLKKVLAGIGIAVMLAAGFLLSSLTLGPAFAQTQQTSSPAQIAIQSPNDDQTEANVKGSDEQQPQYTGSIQVEGAQYKGMSEAQESVALQLKAIISATDAKAAALAANAGASVVKTKLDNENSVLVYSVELSNGKDVKVDAGTGKVLHTESGELDSQGGSGEQETVED